MAAKHGPGKALEALMWLALDVATPMADRVRSSLSNAVAGFVRPEYTGENRCWPCTVANVVVLAVCVGVAALFSPPLAAVLAVTGVGAITLRGYVVPYTPVFAPLVVERLPVSKRAGERTDVGSVAAPDRDGEDVLDALVEAGVVHGETDLVLDESFRDRWRSSIERHREEDLAAELEATIPRVSVDRHTWRGDVRYSLASTTDEERSSSLSRPVALADVAAVKTTTDRGVSRAVACRATRPLRQFLSTCPECDAALTVRDASCCGGFGPGGPTEVLACDDCDAHVFAFPE